MHSQNYSCLLPAVNPSNQKLLSCSSPSSWAASCPNSRGLPSSPPTSCLTSRGCPPEVSGSASVLPSDCPPAVPGLDSVQPLGCPLEVSVSPALQRWAVHPRSLARHLSLVLFCLKSVTLIVCQFVVVPCVPSSQSFSSVFPVFSSVLCVFRSLFCCFLDLECSFRFSACSLLVLFFLFGLIWFCPPKFFIFNKYHYTAPAMHLWLYLGSTISNVAGTNVTTCTHY